MSSSNAAGGATGVRRAALEILLAAEKNGSYINIAADSAIKRGCVAPADVPLLTSLLFGVTERRLTLDRIISRLAHRAVSQQLMTILRLGLYQLRYLDRIPPHAAVNETVALAKTGAERGFVNALLRAYLRQSESFADVTLPGDDDETALSVTYSVAPWICRRFRESFGADAGRVLAAMNEKPPLDLRANTLRVSRDALGAALAGADIPVSVSARAPSCITVPDGFASRLALGESADYFVQDEASQLCVAALGAQPGEFVLDVCAAPGGKSFGIAADMENRGRLISLDLHENKLSLIRSGAARLGITVLSAAAGDARVYNEALSGADRVLCDVPCSGLGVIAKKPELRYKNEADAAALPAIQYAILENCSRYLSHGGTLVYSTCTLLPEENGGVFTRFLAEHGEFAAMDFTLGGLRSESGMLTLRPDLHGTDGFFIAKATRR